MLSEPQCMKIENALSTDPEPRKTAAYLCLHMGLTLAEAAGLRWRDIDLLSGAARICNVVANAEGGRKTSDMRLLPSDAPRTLPLPPHVRRFLVAHRNFYAHGDSFIMTGDTILPALYPMQNLLNSINSKYKIAPSLSAMELRSAFIRRCIQSGMDLYSLCAYIAIKQPNAIINKYGEYFTSKFAAVNALEKYGADYTPDATFDGPRRLNLLILGAGSQGPVIKEIAEALGVFNEIAFLDDNPKNKLAIGPLSDYVKLVNVFPVAIPSFGDSELRARYYGKLREAGYAIPRLIHPSATISGSDVRLGDGVVVEAKVIIGNDVTVEENVILSAGCVLDKECVVRANAHVGCACTVTKGSEVAGGASVPAGTIHRMRYGEVQRYSAV